MGDGGWGDGGWGMSAEKSFLDFNKGFAVSMVLDGMSKEGGGMRNVI